MNHNSIDEWSRTLQTHAATAQNIDTQLPEAFDFRKGTESLYQNEQPIPALNQQLLAGALALVAAGVFANYEEIIGGITEPEYPGDQALINAEGGVSRRSLLKAVVAGVVCANVWRNDIEYGTKNSKEAQEIDAFAAKIVDTLAVIKPEDMFKYVWGTDVPGMYSNLSRVAQGSEMAQAVNYSGGNNSDPGVGSATYKENEEQAALIAQDLTAVKEAAKASLTAIKQVFSYNPQTDTYQLPDAYINALTMNWATQEILRFVEEKNKNAEFGRHLTNTLGTIIIMGVSIPIIEMIIRLTNELKKQEDIL